MWSNADPMSVIHSGLREAISRGEQACVTFEVDGMANRWVQYVGGTVNAAHLVTGAPDIAKIPTVLKGSLGEITLVSWEPLTFVTLGIGKAEIGPLAKLIDWMFTELQGCEPGRYHLNVSIEDV